MAEEQKKLGGRDAEPKEEAPRQVARDKHRLSEMVDPTFLNYLLKVLENALFSKGVRRADKTKVLDAAGFRQSLKGAKCSLKTE